LFTQLATVTARIGIDEVTRCYREHVYCALQQWLVCRNTEWLSEW